MVAPAVLVSLEVSGLQERPGHLAPLVALEALEDLGGRALRHLCLQTLVDREDPAGLAMAPLVGPVREAAAVGFLTTLAQVPAPAAQAPPAEPVGSPVAEAAEAVAEEAAAVNLV